MTTWILILSLYVGNAYGGGSSMVTIPFQTKAACLNAGNAWIKHERLVRRNDSDLSVSALCIPAQP